MKKRLFILLISIILLPLAGQAQERITAIVTNVTPTPTCANNGSIDLVYTGNTGAPTAYGIVKSPYNEANIIKSSNPLFSNLEPGDYYYGYYIGITFFKASTTVTVAKNDISVSISTPLMVPYCSSDGYVSGVISGTAPYTVTLLDKDTGTEVKQITTTTNTYKFTNVAEGYYIVKAVDACGAVGSSTSDLSRIHITAPTIDVSKLRLSLSNKLVLSFNTVGDYCSGIATAAFIPECYYPEYVFQSNNARYKLEIQKEKDGAWEVHDNLSSVKDVSYSLPSDHTKWGKYRVTATLCGDVKTKEYDLGDPLIFQAPTTPTGASSQEFCKASNPKVSDLVTTETGVTWYDAATGGNELTSTTTLTNGTVYYGLIKGEYDIYVNFLNTLKGTCENGTRLAVTVTLNDPKKPTGSASQTFCKNENKTVADLVTNETGVTWYDAATAGNVVTSTTALVNNRVYYGSLKVGTCESPTRFAVTVTISDPQTPTGSASQTFNKNDTKKVSDLVTNEAGVTWYDAATAGNVVSSTTALTNGTVYYGSLKAGTCSSPTRFAVTVTLNDPQTQAQVIITAVATNASCVGNGTLTVTVTNVAAPITYGVAKLPYNEATVIASLDPVFTHLAAGDYYYGYYDGTTFVKAGTSINVGSTYSTVSPTITRLSAKNYTYCGNETDPLGKITIGVSGGNAPYTISLLKASDNSEVAKTTTSALFYDFTSLQPGTYSAKLVDNCGVTTTSINNITLAANAVLTSNDIYFNVVSDPRYGGVSVVYNTAGDVCSGIKSASFDNGFRAVVNNAYINSTPSFTNSSIGYGDFTYKLEIQNGTDWFVHDNLTFAQVSGSFSLPIDRSKWGKVRLTATFCGVSKTATLDYGASTIGKVIPFSQGWFSISDDAANTICAKTGKVYLSGTGYGGCLPYTLEVTDTETNDKVTYTTPTNSSHLNCLLVIGKTYSFKFTDNTGVEPTQYVLLNQTSNAIKPSPSIGGPANVFIDPTYFSPAATNLRSLISFYRRPSGINFNKSALAVIVPYSGFTGALTASLISGPSPISWTPLNVSISGKKAYNLGENLTPGTYKIRLQDSACFDEVFEVEVNCYFSKIEITSISAAPSTTVCDRYVKKVGVSVSMVGTADAFGSPFYFSAPRIFVQTVSGPVSGWGRTYYNDYNDYSLREGFFEFTYDAEASGTYEIGITNSIVSGFLPVGNLWKDTTTKTIKVEPNFPAFDLSKSGGIICTGNTTGDLYVKVDNAVGTVTYFLKRETDAGYPATGQTSTVFTGLTAGNYVVKAKTSCYEVEQPLILRIPLTKVVSGTASYCEGGSLSLAVNQAGPVSTIKWTAPDGTTYNTAALNLDHLTAANSGSYKVEVTSLGGCYFTENFNVTMNNVQTPTGASAQVFCKTSDPKVSNLVTNETGVIWYDAATGGAIVSATTALVNGTTYYGTLQLGNCKSTSRLAVTVTVNDPQTPTGTASQTFCKNDNKTVADLVTNETGVTWYDAATAGNVVTSTTALINNRIYYGSLKVGTCESPIRFAVTVTLNNPQKPTGAWAQVFCKSNDPKVSNLFAHETGVIWYDAATEGNIVSATTALTNGSVYYGSLKVGTCESPTRLAVTVTVNDPQTPTGSASQTFCKRDNNIVANLATNETGVTWYDAATGGNVVSSSTALTNGTVYYGSLRIGTCESPTRFAVTVTVNDPQTPTGIMTQNFCQTDNPTFSSLVTNESGVSWYTLSQGGNAIVSSTALRSGMYYGSLKIGTCEGPRCLVRVTVETPNKPTGSANQEFCKANNPKVSNLFTNEGIFNTLNPATGQMESIVSWYDSATGGNAIERTTALTTGTVYYGSKKIGTCESSERFAVTVTLNDPQTPTGTASQTFCKNENKTVADLATNETGVTWYDAATAGNIVTATTALVNNRIYYGSLKIGTCESPTRFAVTVTLNDPQTPTGTASQTFCKNDNKKVSDLVTTETSVTWYDAATAGNIVTATTSLTNGTVYYGSLKVGTCESPTRFAVTVTVNDPQTPTGIMNQNFCQTDNPTFSSLVTNESGVSWYTLSQGGNAIVSSTALRSGMYYGSLKIGTCEGPRFLVRVTVETPNKPTGSANQEFCKANNPKVSNLFTNEGIFNQLNPATGQMESIVSWYDSATGGNAIARTTALTTGTVYYGSKKQGTCESSERFAVTVTLNDPQTPTGTASQTFCKNDNKTVADLVTTETGVTWYDAATSGNIVSATTALTNGNVYYGSLKVGTCESPTRFAVTVTLNDPQTPTGTASQTFCKNDNKKVSDLVTTETGVTWFDSATAGNVVTATTALLNNRIYYGSLKVGTCESPTRFAVTVTLNDPQTPTGTASQTFCKNDNKKVSDLVTNETGVTWYDSATAGNVVTATTTLVNNRIYYGSLKVGTCESPRRLAVTVTLNDPQTPTGTASQTFCKNDNKKVSDLVTNETGVTWYDAATNGNIVTATTTLVNNRIYYGSLKIGTCESPTRFAVTVTLNDPQTPTGTASQTFCKNDNKTVADLATNETGVTWYDAATAGNVVTSTTALVNNRIYYGSLKVGTCESPTRFAVTVTLNDPQTPTGTASQTFCKNDNKTVADLVTTETGVTWYDAATSGNIVSATAALTNGTIYYGSLKIGTCESPTRFAVTVTLNDPQTPTGTASQTFCKNDNKKVSDLVTTETGVTWYDAATNGNIVTATTTLVNNRIYYGSLKIGTCESPTRFAVTVNLNDPQTPTGTASQTFCKNDAKTVADLVTTETGVTWYDAAIAGNVVTSTTALVNNRIYYGSLKVGTCESPSRFAVTVTLNDPQTPTGTASQTFCKNDNKTVADLVTNETGVTWYDAATAGNVVTSTTALVNNRIYYGSLKVGTCESPSRFAVTVTLNDPQTPTGTASQTFCKSENKTVADLATNETGVTWYDAATNGSIVTATTTLVNNRIYYGSLKVGTCESPTRFAVTVTLNDPQTPTGTASQTFCKNDNKTVADLVTTETGVTWYDAATSGNVVTATTTLEHNKVYYGSLKVGTCESPTRFAVTVILNDPQTPTGIASQTFCKNDNKKVSDLVTAETGVTWYDAATNGNIVTATTVLTNGTVYYGSLKVGTCESPTRFAVTVTLNDPQTPTGTASQTFCKNDTKTVADLVTNETGVTWYDAATAGNIVTATTALVNNRIYYGSLKVGTCESPTRFAVTVTLNDPQTPTGTASQTFCKNDNKTVTDLVTNETGVTWYDAATAGNVVTATTALVNNRIYYGSLKVGTCESPTRFAVTVTLNDPQTPTGSASQTFCKSDNKTVADLVTNETGVTWYDSATAGNVVTATTALTNGTVYYGSLKVGTCESPIRFAVTVTLNDPQTPTGTASQTFCKNDNKKVSDLATTETGVTWYDAATAGNIVSATAALTNGTIYYGSLKVGTCESPIRFAVTVTLNDPQTPTGTASQTFCKNDNKTVANLTTNETGVTWYDTPTAGNAVTATTTLENNKIYYGSLKVGTCESPTRFAVTVTLNDPQTPTGTASQTFCKNDNKKVSDLVTTETGVTWYDAATAGNVVTATTSLTNGNIYYGSLKVGTCESPTRFAVTVTLNDPQTPTGTASQTFCKNDNKKVSDLVTTETSVTWYDAATAGNIVTATTSLTNGTVYYGSLKVGTCESPTRFAVTVTLNDPQTPTGIASQTFCKNENKKVSDLVTTETGVTWYDAATAGNVVTATTALTNGTVYYGSLKVGTCESPTRFAVTITLNDPQTPTGSASQTFCKNDTKTVADLATNETGVTWYDAATAGNIVTTTTALVNNRIYYGSLKVGTCESPTRFAVTVTLNDPQTPTGTASQTFCKNDNKTVSDLATNETGVTWYDAATAGNIVSGTTALTNGSIYYGSLKVGTCESPTRFAVTVTLNDPQTPTGIASQTFCKNDNKTVADLVTNETGVTWYDAASGGNIVATTTALTNGSIYYGSLKIGTCESPTRFAVTVTLNDPQAPTGTASQTFCKNDTKTVADLVTNETGVTWYDAATAGNVVTATTSLTNGNIYYGSLKVGTCESPTRFAVTVTINNPQTPTTGSAKQEFPLADHATVAHLATVESGVIWYDAANGGKIIPLSTLLEDGKTYYGSLKVGNCESTARLEIKVSITNNVKEPVPPESWNTTVCVFSEVTYKTVSGKLDYDWKVSKEGTIVAGGQLSDDFVTVLWKNVGKGSIVVEYFDINKITPVVTVHSPITINSCSDIGLKKVVDNANPSIGKEVVFTITAENLGTAIAKDIVISEILPSGYEYVTSEVSSGSYNPTDGIWQMPILKSKENQTLKITAKVKEKGDYLNVVYLKTSNPVDTNESNNRAEASIKVKDVIVYNAVSSNGDGLNDYLRIDGLDQYPNNSVEIFNSGGVQIFKTSNYGNDNNVFRGISDGRATINKKIGVPTGTYFYILQYEMNGKMIEKSGYLYVTN